MDRDLQIFLFGFGCGTDVAYERMRGLYDNEINKHMNAIDWESEKMFDTYNKVKIAFPEVFNKD